MINKTKEEIRICLMYYIPRKYWVLNDWDIIIKRCYEVEDNVFLFKCSFFDLYFDNEIKNQAIYLRRFYKIKLK